MFLMSRSTKNTFFDVFLIFHHKRFSNGLIGSPTSPWTPVESQWRNVTSKKVPWDDRFAHFILDPNWVAIVLRDIKTIVIMIACDIFVPHRTTGDYP